MNVLMLGVGQGSFEVRGRQMGVALNARVSSAMTSLDWADVVVLIKRADPKWADEARRAGKPVVWDALDFWQQPDQNHLSPDAALSLLHEQIARYRPDLVIGATQAMASAANGVYLPHHARPGLVPAPVRESITTVAYEGTKKYLGRWAADAEFACTKRGWQFVINPPDLRDADLILACRDGNHDGWICRQWKSGVKIVNAIAAGRPVIGQPCAAWRELAPEGTLVDSPSELDAAFDQWTDRAERARVSRVSSMRWPTWALHNVAATYREVLHRVALRQAVEA